MNAESLITVPDIQDSIILKCYLYIEINLFNRFIYNVSILENNLLGNWL